MEWFNATPTGNKKKLDIGKPEGSFDEIFSDPFIKKSQSTNKIKKPIISSTLLTVHIHILIQL